MKRIFLDTNILIDYIDNRQGADEAEQIFACGFSGEALLFASSLTFANMAYIIKGRTQEEKYDALKQMATIVEILPLSKEEVLAAIALPAPECVLRRNASARSRSSGVSASPGWYRPGRIRGDNRRTARGSGRCAG